MKRYTFNLDSLRLTKCSTRRTPRNRWVAIHPDGSRYTVTRRYGAWWWSSCDGAGPTIADAIDSAAQYGVTIIKEPIASN